MNIMANKVILWSAPRCLSNAFLCSISTLKCTKHFHDLFSGPHYFGPDHRNRRYDDFRSAGELTHTRTYDICKQILLADYPDTELVFTKEAAYCVPECMWQELVNGDFEDFTHTFLIRDPRRAVFSHYQAILKDKIGKAGLDESELGFAELHKLYNFIKEKKGTTPVVIDAIDLQTHPDETMKTYCEAVGIQFDPNMTTWEKGSTKNWCNMWSPVWYSTLDQSTGFIKIKPEEQKPVPVNELPHDLIKYIDECCVYYNEMKRDCLQPAAIQSCTKD